MLVADAQVGATNGTLTWLQGVENKDGIVHCVRSGQ